MLVLRILWTTNKEKYQFWKKTTNKSLRLRTDIQGVKRLIRKMLIWVHKFPIKIWIVVKIISPPNVNKKETIVRVVFIFLQYNFLLYIFNLCFVLWLFSFCSIFYDFVYFVKKINLFDFSHFPHDDWLEKEKWWNVVMKNFGSSF